jgi:mono/diheme cytochrome c family protein
MLKRSTAIFCAAIVVVTLPPHILFAAESAQTKNLIAKARSQRISDTDLAISGDLAGLPAGSTRYLSRTDLLTLPVVTYTVSDDPNFAGPTEITGVLLEELRGALVSDAASDLVIAVCDDKYQAHYTRSYLADHQPVLVLTVNGQSPKRWPKDAEGQGQSMGPYMISHRRFDSNLRGAAHHQEAQIPWGVIKLEFRNERNFFSKITPPRDASTAAVQDGYRIAQQNCLRCHNRGDVGGQKAGHPWLVLSAWAAASPDFFASYVLDPKSKNPRAEMPANPNYDPATLQKLIAYFRTFQLSEKP